MAGPAMPWIRKLEVKVKVKVKDISHPPHLIPNRVIEATESIGYARRALRGSPAAISQRRATPPTTPPATPPTLSKLQ